MRPSACQTHPSLAAAVLTASLLAAVPIIAQQRNSAEAPRDLTSAEYARAERFLAYNTAPLVLRAGVRPTWLPDDRFWYRVTTERGTEFLLVDPVKATRGPAFDHAKLAAALSQASDTKYSAYELPFQQFEFAADGRTITFDVGRRRWSCATDGSRCSAAGEAEPAPAGRGGGRRGGSERPPEILSPDRKRAAFIRDHDLWVRDVAGGRETRLTVDGVKDFAYATNNAGWTKSDRPVLLWSPDSTKIATFQHDQRKVGEMYLVDTRVGRSELQAWKYPLVGDEHIITIQRVVVDVEAGEVVRFQMPPDPHRSTLCDHIVCRGNDWVDVQWSPDSSQVAFVSSSRDHKRAQLRLADASTGTIRDVLDETVKTFFESGNGRVNWRVLFGSGEVIWYSQRDNWGQLYLYDLDSGALKHQITSGEGNVTQLLRVDEKGRTLYFQAVGKDPERDPYFTHLYKIGMDGSDLQLLTPEDAHHEISLSDSGRYFVDTYSKPDVPPIATLRAADGRTILTLEQADISRLLATGWKPPMPFTVKARDGETDLYGLLYRPTNFDASKKYPIINHIYPGPQTGSVGNRSFSPARGDTQALAELGFIVVQIDGMGTPWRSKTFHEAYYGDMGDNTLPDQIAGMKQLAQKYSWIDLESAGIYGHSGGGYAAAAAMFRHPDFFKVGVSQAGNHDNRNYEDDWGEKWHGLLEPGADGTTNYDDQANQTHAKNLKGKLLLAHGSMDSNVPFHNTLLVVDALIRENKDFDLIIFPNRGHGFGSEPYMVRRRWDYFVKHLMGAEPPKEYKLKPAAVSGT